MKIAVLYRDSAQNVGVCGQNSHDGFQIKPKYDRLNCISSLTRVLSLQDVFF